MLVSIVGGLIFALIVYVGIRIYQSVTSKKPPRGTPGRSAPRAQAQRSICCPHCGKELRRVGPGPVPATFGATLRSCPHCCKEYCDAGYRELALEEAFSGLARWEAGDRNAEMEASRKRLADRDYFQRLAASAYGQQPSVDAALHAYAERRLRPYIETLQAKARLHYEEFRVRDFDGTFERLTYEAHDPAAVERVVREILGHYGLDGRTIRVQVDYAREPVPVNGGTLGAFTPGGAGGLVRVVMDRNYSNYDSVVAVALHECAHALLNALRIRYPDRDENERFTDLAAIYFGGGRYILRGYFPSDGRRIGYLNRIECEAAQALVQKLREKYWAEAAAACNQAESDWTEQRDRLKALAEEVEALARTLHPGRVLREAAIRAELEGMWQAGAADRAEALRLTADKPEAAKPAAERARALEDALMPFRDALREWQAAERYQAQLSASSLDMVRGVGPLAEQGNAFAMLELIRFWHGCPATRRDAALLQNKLLAVNDRDSLCALGLCCREGLGVEKNEAAARDYFRRAAALGSPDAQRLLDAEKQ